MMSVAAFRYCLGRKTYIAGTCADWLIDQWDNIGEANREIIQRELEAEFTADDLARSAGEQNRPLGMDCDRHEWEKVRFLWTHPEYICQECRVLLVRDADCLKCPKCGFSRAV